MRTRHEVEMSVGWMREHPHLAVAGWAHEKLAERDALIRELIEHEGAEGFSASTYDMIDRWKNETG